MRLSAVHESRVPFKGRYRKGGVDKNLFLSKSYSLAFSAAYNCKHDSPKNDATSFWDLGGECFRLKMQRQLHIFSKAAKTHELNVTYG